MKSLGKIDVDWYNIVNKAGQYMPVWGGHWMVCRADDILIELIGIKGEHGEEVFLTVSNKDERYTIKFFDVDPLINYGRRWGTKFVPTLKRSEFNAWAQTTGGILERATQNLNNRS